MIAKLKLRSRVKNGQMKECPLSYTCELMCNQYINDGGDFRCENDEACEQFSLSWNLPYEYDENEKVLTVTNDPVRFHWQKEIGKSPKFEPHCHINEMQAGFYYRAMSVDAEEIIDYREIIRREWQKTGWSAASPIRETEAETKKRKLLKEVRKLIEMLLN